jgi:hypothetical protein
MNPVIKHIAEYPGAASAAANLEVQATAIGVTTWSAKAGYRKCIKTTENPCHVTPKSIPKCDLDYAVQPETMPAEKRLKLLI